MSTTPMEVQARPFAVEPVTRMMLPDGIFDNAIYSLQISCHYTNASAADLSNVRIYLESVADPGVVPDARTFAFATIPAGASVLVSWAADFQNATPGKHLISFVANADGYDSHRSIQQIFVSQTRYDPNTNSYTCTVGEGTLTMSDISALAPAAEGWWRCNPDKPSCPPTGFGPYVPTGATMVWQPNPAYAGVHGELPFADPWWKIIALIVLIVAAIVAIVAAALGAGKASFSAGGTFEETDPSVHCCSLKGAGSGMPEYTVAGVASAIASGALAVACADAADPFYRGQAATPPGESELTVGERVVAKWNLPVAPNAGTPYQADVSWSYERFTTGASYQHSVSEQQTNQHTLGDVTVDAPAVVHAYEPLWVKTIFTHDDGTRFSGADLYAFALFRAPGGLYFVVDLRDDGLSMDDAANDGVYTGMLELKRARRILLAEGQDVFGRWTVYTFAQDVNRTAPGTPPVIAAQHFGGMFVSSAIEITFDPSLPCPLKAQATIEVV